MEELARAPAVSLTLSIPLDPEYLNRQLQAVAHQLRGMMMIPNFRLTVLVPAGMTVEIPFPLPKGYVCTRRSPLHFESDYYSRDITIDVFCDGIKVNPFPLSLTGPFDVDFGMYYVKKERVDIVIRNASTTDAEVTFQVIPHIITRELYEEWYEPLTRMAFDVLSEMVKVRRLARL